MTDSTNPRHPRRTAAILIGILVIVIAAVAIIGVTTAQGRSSASRTTGVPSSSTASPSAPATTQPSSSASSSPNGSAAPSKPSAPATAATPQPTRTASIASPAPIAKALTASVLKMEAVQGKAQGPGEIAGPAVRFTISIKNTTGKAVSLADTVVNAYYGSASTPAVELQEPGGRPFPPSVASGDTARGVFVFTVPEAQRSSVVVTVDTSVNNPVVAFRGSAPR